MHFVTGGAYNGKGEWVAKQYGIHRASNSWYSAYHSSPPPDVDNFTEMDGVIVWEGIEYWVKDVLTYSREEEIQQRVQQFLIDFAAWENNERTRKVIIIGTDITKGIVPVDEKDRLLRDVCGRVYQQIAKQASQMDIIWYGIAQKIK
ncbi:bifunctional adenosylcobinamide kinase/adenosylcobinamide-phosphate guanylyltransferase [Cytobacillus sp. FSL K6-0265]|uniref:bifunctional adenosylcobinamide kinase/adenosylcobinamide-phosphate guanylyltransferase n=1 Tax=Cytobacillus sp. FSL K6-0265 TaxID=2921448 RepID=UPI0030FBDFAE